MTDLQRAKAFYEALGFTSALQRRDQPAMVWSQTINVMLLTHAKWRGFTNPPVTVMLAISCDSREAVDRMNEAAAKHGGTADINAKQDLGFLYNRSLTDPDGHVWEAMWMDPSAVPAAG